MKGYVCLVWIFHAVCLSAVVGYECSYKRNTVLHASNGGKISGSRAVVLDFHTDPNLSTADSLVCKLTVTEPGFANFQILAVPSIPKCGSELTVRKPYPSVYRCNLEENIPRSFPINESLDVSITLNLHSRPFNSDYCIRITGNVELNVHCFKENKDGGIGEKTPKPDSDDVVAPVIGPVVVVIIIFILAALSVVIIKRRNSKSIVGKPQKTECTPADISPVYNDLAEHPYDTLSRVHYENDVRVTYANDGPVYEALGNHTTEGMSEHPVYANETNSETTYNSDPNMTGTLSKCNDS